MYTILLDNFVNDKTKTITLPIIPRIDDWIDINDDEFIGDGETLMRVRRIILKPDSNIITVIVDDED